MKEPPMKRIALLLAFATVLSASPALANDAATVAPGDTLLTITAIGNSTRTPDVANFSAGITTIGGTASAAMASNAAAMTRVIGALKTAGVADRDVQTSNLSLNPVYDTTAHGDADRPRITGYQATNTVAVRSRVIGDMGRVIDALVTAGANEVSGPNFAIDHPEAALDEARTSAIATARSRAELYARASGLKVLRILSISESGGYSPRPMMVMARKPMAATTPVVAGEVGVDINLTVQFELAPQ
ncbi:MAG: SIMPL domain-containing protein [Pseudomonadota bacterium]|nr:SIMPL domain-containing protein [Pseudomonadota bacterium]